MNQFRNRQTQIQPTNSSDDPPAAPGGSGLLGQARAFANVARTARENCQQQYSAEEQVQRRRNRSGE